MIELTFSKHAKFTNNQVMILPNKLDQNNDPIGPDYNIVFEN